MSEIVRPENTGQMVELIQFALAGQRNVSLTGSNSLAGFGYTTNADIEVSMSAFAGIIDYEPAELVMRARAGTSLAEVNRTLAENDQHLAFEPMQLGGLYQPDAETGTIAGVFMANLSGSRRFQTGAARDHLLGFSAVNGRAELYKSGGNVIKNVTGYDLSKVLCGSWGTLSLLSELSFKVLPRPPCSGSVMITDISFQQGFEILSQLAGSSVQASGLAFLPDRDVLGSDGLPDMGDGACLVRIEGSPTSVDVRIRELENLFSGQHAFNVLGEEESSCAWHNINNAIAFREMPVVMKLSVPPSTGTDIAGQLAGIEGCRWYADAAGAWFWLAMPEVGAASHIQCIRDRVSMTGGSAVLYKAGDKTKKSAGVFSPMNKALAELNGRIKNSFDPAGIFNPGRLGTS